jgi:hypothetical protein
MSEYNEQFEPGQEIEFTYKGSIEEFFNTRQRGTIDFEPVIRWQGGTCPVRDYAEDVTPAAPAQ